MQSIYDTLQLNAGLLATAGLVIAIVALLVAWWAGRRPARAGYAITPSATLVDDPALDQILSAQMQRLDALVKDVQGLGARTRSVETVSRQAVQSMGLVRFNPFREDTGGNLSFALAMLDADDNGIVISSLHSRQTTRVYLKAITAGRADAALSDEESEALRQARDGGIAAP
ncbi:MAG: hypothetical protein QOH61_671 [Chloroflexota bacterium]|jgi:hypothetical protein|nr:hypothetical protein [Chloroflexota bacterium]